MLATDCIFAGYYVEGCGVFGGCLLVATGFAGPGGERVRYGLAYSLTLTPTLPQPHPLPHPRPLSPSTPPFLASQEYTRKKVSDFLHSHSAYELIPESGKVTVLDVDLPVRQAFHALHEQVREGRGLSEEGLRRVRERAGG